MNDRHLLALLLFTYCYILFYFVQINDDIEHYW